MKKKIIVILVCIIFLLTIIPITEAQDIYQANLEESHEERSILLDPPEDITPSFSVKCRAFLIGRISGLEWVDSDLDIDIVFAFVYWISEDAKIHIPILGFVIQKTWSFESVRDFKGFYNDRWICGTVFYSFRIGLP